jgi:hypothetical protein
MERLQNHIIRQTGKLVTFEMVMYPEFKNFTRNERLTSMKILAIYLNFIAKINVENRNILLLKNHFENDIYF